MVSKKTVKIDAFPESAFRYLNYDAVVCVDVIRATTTAVTAAVQGRRVFPAVSVDDAMALAERLVNPLLAGEVKGIKPESFEIQNSPAAVEGRLDTERPMVLVSSSGTHLILNASGRGLHGRARVYLACLRNIHRTAEFLAGRHSRIALLGAGTRGEFRVEDQIGVAWIAEELFERGFEAEDESTAQLVTRWSGADVGLAAQGNSAAYLRRSNQLPDLEFVIEHVNDIDAVCVFEGGEIRRIDADPGPSVARSPATETTVAPPAASRRLGGGGGSPGLRASSVRSRQRCGSPVAADQREPKDLR